MAETWTYGVYWKESQNMQLPDHPYVSIQIKRINNTTKDGSMYKIVDGSTISADRNIKTWSSGTLKIGSYGTTDTIRTPTGQADGTAYKFNNIDFSPNDSILSVTSTAVSTNLSINEDPPDLTIFIYGGDGSPAGDGNLLFTIKVQVDNKYTKSTISYGNAEFGSTSTVTISNSSGFGGDLTHYISWSVSGNNQSHSGNTTLSGTGTSSYSIPYSWMDVIPKSLSVTCNLSVETYKGSTYIGTSTGTCTLTVPDSVKPSISSISCSIRNENQGIPNTYIQNTTGVYIQLNNITPSDGTTLNGDYQYIISANVQETYTFDNSNYRYIVDRLANSGEIVFSVSVKDGRGRQSSAVTATINVMAYDLPVITAASAYRCRQDGVADEEGRYATIRIVAEYTQTSGNVLDIDSVYYRNDVPSQRYTAYSNMSSGVSYIIGSGNLDPQYAYSIEFTVEDSLGNIITKTVRVQTSSFAIHVKNGGSGVAVGKASEFANSFEINEGWDMYYKGVIVLPVIFSATEPSSPFEGLVWLEPKT